MKTWVQYQAYITNLGVVRHACNRNFCETETGGFPWDLLSWESCLSEEEWQLELGYSYSTQRSSVLSLPYLEVVGVFCCFVFVFHDRVSVCNSGSPRPCSVDWTWTHRDLSASASQCWDYMCARPRPVLEVLTGNHALVSLESSWLWPLIGAELKG